MVRIRVTRDRKGKYTGFSAEGHAFYEQSGKDVVCAAVSVLTINTVNSIDQFTDDHYRVETNEKTGKMVFALEECGEKSSLLMDAMVLGLSEIERTYGKEYLSLEIREVETC